VPLPSDSREGAYLFPRALVAPGWRHLIGKLIRMGLGSLPVVLAWLELLKKVAKFLREFSVDIRDGLQVAFPSVAECLAQARVPLVAQWRWHTLDNTCRVVGSILQTLRAAFPALKFVHKPRDNKLVDAVRSALSTEAWSLHFDFISWFVRWLVRLMRWVGT
jgi:hypothetical protein